MKTLLHLRQSVNMSQRRLAALASISYKSLQLIEGANHDMRLLTLEKIAVALKYPKKLFSNYTASFFNLPPDSVAIISRQIVQSQSKNWHGSLFNFVDQFRQTKKTQYILEPPCSGLSKELTALLTSVVETLCVELQITIPWWCAGIGPLDSPWFLSEVQNLKALALVESPVHFRKRNVFVLQNFLDRA